MIMNAFSRLATSSVQSASNAVDETWLPQKQPSQDHFYRNTMWRVVWIKRELNFTDILKTIDGVLFNVHPVNEYFIFIRRKDAKHKNINDIKKLVSAALSALKCGTHIFQIE